MHVVNWGCLGAEMYVMKNFMIFHAADVKEFPCHTKFTSIIHFYLVNKIFWTLPPPHNFFLLIMKFFSSIELFHHYLQLQLHKRVTEFFYFILFLPRGTQKILQRNFSINGKIICHPHLSLLSLECRRADIDEKRAFIIFNLFTMMWKYNL